MLSVLLYLYQYTSKIVITTINFIKDSLTKEEKLTIKFEELLEGVEPIVYCDLCPSFELKTSVDGELIIEMHTETEDSVWVVSDDDVIKRLRKKIDSLKLKLAKDELSVDLFKRLVAGALIEEVKQKNLYKLRESSCQRV